MVVWLKYCRFKMILILFLTFVLALILRFGLILTLFGSFAYLVTLMVFHYILYFVLKIRKELKDL